MKSCIFNKQGLCSYPTECERCSIYDCFQKYNCFKCEFKKFCETDVIERGTLSVEKKIEI